MMFVERRGQNENDRMGQFWWYADEKIVILILWKPFLFIVEKNWIEIVSFPIDYGLDFFFLSTISSSHGSFFD